MRSAVEVALSAYLASAHSSSELANTFFPTSFRSLPLLLSKLKHCHAGQGVTIYFLQKAQTTLHITGPIQCSCPSSNLEMKPATPSTRYLARWSTQREREVGHNPHSFQHLLTDKQQQEQLLHHFATSACRQQWAPHLPVFGAAVDALGRHAPCSSILKS